MSNKQIEATIIDRTITTVDSNALSIKTSCFYYCYNISYINLPLCETINAHAFEPVITGGGYPLTYFNAPNLKTIGESAFNGVKFPSTVLYLPSVLEVKNMSFYNTNIQELHIENATTISNNIGMTFPTSYPVYLGKNLSEIIQNLSAASSTQTFIYYFNHSSSDAVLFTPANLFVKGSSKQTYTYNIYTDNATIKDGALAQVDQYTVVNVYKVNGGSW